MKLQICIPVYNGEDTLEEVLDSILEQDKLDCNILLIDDVSTDNTVKICKRYKRKYPKRITYRRNKHNLGYPGNYKRCIELAEGKYIFFIGQDDVMTGNKVNAMVDFLDKNLKVGIVTGDLVVFTDDPLKPIRRNIHFNSQKRYFNAGDEALLNWLFYCVIGSIGGYLVRASVAKEFVDLISSDTIIPQGYLGALIASSYNVAHLPVITFEQRQSSDENQQANKQYFSLRIVEQSFDLMELSLSDLPKSKVKDKAATRKKLIDIYVKHNLVENMVTYRSYIKSNLYFELLKLMISKSRSVLVYPKFWFYLLFTLLLPKSWLCKMLNIYRHKYAK